MVPVENQFNIELFSVSHGKKTKPKTDVMKRDII